MKQILSILLLALLAMPAKAASLKPMTILHAQVVRLSDLFAGLPKGADRVLGPGPGPGGRIIVEAPQLAAIAHQFDVDWHPNSPGERAVLDRPGHPLALRTVVDAVRAAMMNAGTSANIDISMRDFTPPLVPFDAAPEATVAQLDYDATTGNFTGILSVTGPAMDPINLHVGGVATETERVPVAAAQLAAGSILRPDDIHFARVRITRVHNAIAEQPDQVIGWQLRRPLAAGQPLPIDALIRPALVKKGADVLMQLDSPGIALTGEGEALQSGAIGDHIRVLNPASHAVVDAEILGPDKVRVVPGALPIVPARRIHGFGTLSGQASAR